MNMKSPIRKLLVLTNQSSSGSLIYYPYRCEMYEKYAKICEIYIQYSTFADINFSDFLVSFSKSL